MAPFYLSLFICNIAFSSATYGFNNVIIVGCCQIAYTLCDI